MYGQLIDRATGAAAINHSLSKGYKWQFEELRLHLHPQGTVGGAAAGNLTLTIQSATDAVYSTRLLTVDMVTVGDVVYRPPATIKLDKNDRLLVAWTNTNAREWGLELVYY